MPPLSPLPSLPDWLAALRRPAGALGHVVRFAPVVPSTHTWALDLAEAGAPHGTLVTADHQTAGRGRQGRPWQDAPGAALLVSLVLRPPPPPDAAPRVPLAAAVALAHGLERFGFAPTLKWPNDVRIGGRKVAGLLAAQSRGALVLSFGLNVNQIAFPEALAAISTSMALEADRAFDRGAVLAAVLDALEYMLTLVTTNADALRDFYQVILEWIGDEVEIRPHAGTHAIVGTFEDITTEGGLYLRHPDGRAETFYAGDVSLRPVSP